MPKFPRGFVEFLVKAKINSYAKGGDASGILLPDGGKMFVFEEGDYTYTDIYYGFNPFSGQEIVKYKGKTIWIMNYGGTVKEIPASFGIDEKGIYKILRDALQNISPEFPFRGPKEHRVGKFVYHNAWDKATLSEDENLILEDYDFFEGEEWIIHESQLPFDDWLYKLFYHCVFIK